MGEGWKHGGERCRHTFVGCFVFHHSVSVSRLLILFPQHSVYSQQDKKSNNQQQKEFALRNVSAILYPAWQISTVDLWWLLLMNSIKSGLEVCVHTRTSLTERGTEEVSDPTCCWIHLRNCSNQLCGFVASNVGCSFSRFCVYLVWCGKLKSPRMAQMIPQTSPLAHVIWSFFSSLLATLSAITFNLRLCKKWRKKFITTASAYPVIYHWSLNDGHYKEL